MFIQTLWMITDGVNAGVSLELDHWGEQFWMNRDSHDGEILCYRRRFGFHYKEILL
jgi:hypothetical protein